MTCPGVNDIVNGVTASANGYCVGTDKDGDKVFFRGRQRAPDPEPGAATFRMWWYREVLRHSGTWLLPRHFYRQHDGRCHVSGTVVSGGCHRRRSLVRAEKLPRESGAAHSAFLRAGAYSADAGLSPQSGSGRHLFFNRQPARPPYELYSCRGSTRCARRFAVRTQAPFHIDAWSCFRPHALYMDFPGRRCRLPRSLAGNKDRVRESLARRRVAITGHDQPWRARDLAAPLRNIHPATTLTSAAIWIHALQPGEARARRAPGGFATPPPSALRQERDVPGRMDRPRRRAAKDRRAVVRNSRRGEMPPERPRPVPCQGQAWRAPTDSYGDFAVK